MIYFYIDESGDVGNPAEDGSSKDFCMSLYVAHSENIFDLSKEVIFLNENLNKKELKYSKLKKNERELLFKFFEKNNSDIYFSYKQKNQSLNKEKFLKIVFEDLIMQLNKFYFTQKIQIIIDGKENMYYRKIYGKILDKYILRYNLKFKDSRKTPLLQVADFYAGHYRKNFGNIKQQ